jgi:hypothetical protein
MKLRLQDDTPPLMNKRAGTRPDWLKVRIPGDLDRLPLSRLLN